MLVECIMFKNLYLNKDQDIVTTQVRKQGAVYEYALQHKKLNKLSIIV